MFCCGGSKKRSIQGKQTEERDHLQLQYRRYHPSELASYRERFDRMAPAGTFDLETFRENMGLLGLDQISIITDRIFEVMNKSGTGRVTLQEFLDYVDVLMHGTTEEKAEQSFRLITRGRRNHITYDDFANWLISLWKMNNAVTGKEISASEDMIQTHFDKLDLNKDGVIDLEEYKQVMGKDKSIFAWLDTFNLEVAHTISSNMQNKEEIHPKIVKYLGALDSLAEDIVTTIDFLRGELPTPKIKRTHTLHIPPFPSLTPKQVIQELSEMKAESSQESSDCDSREEDGGMESDQIVNIRQILYSLGDQDLPVEESDSEMQRISNFFKSSIKSRGTILRLETPSKKPQPLIIHEDRLALPNSADIKNRTEYAARLIEKIVVRLDMMKASVAYEEDLEHKLHNNPRYNVPKVISRKVIHWGDEDWNLILNMMLGIQKSVKATAVSLDAMKEVIDAEFTAIETHNLIPGNTNRKLKIYKFRDYAPNIFERIRRMYGIQSQDYIKSLGVETIMRSLMMGEFSSLVGQCSSGKSGSFFYYSDDGKYMLKTMSREEFKFFRHVLPAYYNHLSRNSHTLVIRYFGFHKIIFKKNNSYRRIPFVVMSNVFNPKYEVHERYDLKGSIQGRFTRPDEDHTVARKDLDFNRLGRKLFLGENKRFSFIQQIQRDCEFFIRENIIDYSLLLGIHRLGDFKGEIPKRAGFVPFTQVDDGGLLSSDGKTLYFIGIIDILTNYNTRKKLEHMIKAGVYGSDTISCIPPQNYAQRFIDYIESIIE